MGTKNNPGKFDCYSRAEPDEPVFVLLGRDPVAWLLVYEWAKLRELMGGTEPEILEEAALCAMQMEQWAKGIGKEQQVREAQELHQQVREGHAARKLCQRAADALEKAADIIEQQVMNDYRGLRSLINELRSV